MIRKAQWYAERHNLSGDKLECLAETLTDFLLESQELIGIRKAQTDAALIGILNEQELKWKAFVRRTQADIPENLFATIVKSEMPSIHEFWKGGK